MSVLRQTASLSSPRQSLKATIPSIPSEPDIGRIVPPEELYLRELMDLDLTDGQAICEFTRRYGRLETERWGSLPRWYVEDWR